MADKTGPRGMETKLLLGLIVICLFFTSGCVEKECTKASDCPTKACLEAGCANNKCAYSPAIPCCGNGKCETGEAYENCPADCPNCDDSNDCTTDLYDYHEQECANEIITPCCGNEICDKDAETYEECPGDCPNCDDGLECTKDSYDYHEQKCVHAPIPGIICCGNGVCELGETYETCTMDCPSCDDENECTTDSYDYHKQECAREIAVPCCGNGICDEGAETSANCTMDCQDCDDKEKLTGDIFNYATQECEYVTYYFFEDFDDGTISWLDPNAPKCTTDARDASCDPRWGVVFLEDDNGVLTNVNNDQAYTGFGDQEWSDYTLSYKVKREDGAAHAYARRSGGAYAVTLFGHQLQLWKDAKPVTELETKNMSFSPDQFYDIRIELKGANIKVYVNGTLEIDYKDADPILSGNIGFDVGKKAYFDDVTVEAPR